MKREAPPRAWLVAGPTASGKSRLALDLATAIDGEIVNADSMQVYADLEILTARPGPESTAARPHHLYGVADAREAWSVGRWLTEARRCLAEIASRARPAVVVGGTGLYLRALTEGLADIPPIPPAVREAAATRLTELGEPGFRAELAAFDAETARRIERGDALRLTRAMEVWLATGRSLSDWRAHSPSPIAPGDWRAVVVDLPRAELYRRCDLRLAAMVRDGALDEVRRLIERDLPARSPLLKALGVAPLAAHLRGETSLEEALASAQTDTRRYAKRQLTWFRNQTPDWPRLAPDPDGVLRAPSLFLGA
ncbi:MAG TPA: tRNA (adenosine(37)-N6)-dimethylallyltransferase MiaA [Caulobacteraceae bacterium]|jgi:tRNA dimethylallyltransferase|nr:tRNA (adenosine(37)-N6)-dimethylallyltransferase MiaA [Caulobacteraceae bacterium]